METHPAAKEFKNETFISKLASHSITRSLEVFEVAVRERVESKQLKGMMTAPPGHLMSHRVFCFAHHHHHHYPINGPGRNSFRWFPWRELNLKRRQGPSLLFLSALHAAAHLLSGQLVTHPPTPNKHSSAHVSSQEPKQNPLLSQGALGLCTVPQVQGTGTGTVEP